MPYTPASFFLLKGSPMLEQLSLLPPDPILGLAAACRADPNPDKIDLTVGVYMDEDGICPVFEAVKQAQAALVAEEVTKAYLPAAGDVEHGRHHAVPRPVGGQDAPWLRR